MSNKTKELLAAISTKLAELTTDVERLAALLDQPITETGDFPTLADEHAVSRLRRGERVNLKPRPGGMWSVNFRPRGADAVTGETAASIHLALESSAAHAGFPAIPEDGESLTPQEKDALVRLRGLADAPECSVRWEKRDTHSEHEFHGAKKTEKWSEPGLLVEAVDWLEEERRQAVTPNGDPEDAAAARVFTMKPAQLHRPKADTGHRWAVLGPRSRDDGGTTHGFGDSIDAAIAEYERKTGDSVPASAPGLSEADAAALQWYQGMNAAGPTSIRRDSQGGWHGEYYRRNTGARFGTLGRTAGIAGVVDWFKSEGL